MQPTHALRQSLNALRALRGGYYTPEPVVQFIVRAVDRLLQTDFGKPPCRQAPQRPRIVPHDDGIVFRRAESRSVAHGSQSVVKGSRSVAHG